MEQTSSGNVSSLNKEDMEAGQAQFLQSLLNAIPVPVFYKDVHGVYQGCNQAFEAFLGKTRDQIIGKTVYELAPGDLARSYHEADVELAQQGGVQVYENSVVYADHTRHDVIFNKAVVLNQDGSRGGIVGTMLDITEQKRSQEAIQRRDAILEAVGFAARLFLETADWERNIQAVLAGLGRATGVSRVYVFENHTDEHGRLMMSQRYEWSESEVEPQLENSELQNLSYHEIGFDRWARMLSQGQSIYGHVSDFPPEEQAVLVPQDICSIAVVPIFMRQNWWGLLGFDQCHSPRNWSVVEVDTLKVAASIIGSVLARVQAERLVQQSEQRYHELFDNASDIVYSHDLEGTFVEVNAAAERVLGYTRDELLAMNIAQVVAPEYLEFIREMVQQKLGTGGSTAYELEVIAKDGRRIAVETSSRLITQNGHPVGVQGIVRDITERKRAEAMMRQSIKQEEIIRAQEVVLAKLATPLLRIDDHVLLVPLIGMVDLQRAGQVIDQLLHGVAAQRAHTAILDITGVSLIDTQIANMLVQMAQAVRLLGAQVVITGIGPDVAQTLVSLGTTLPGVVTCGSLQQGIAYALRHNQ